MEKSEKLLQKARKCESDFKSLSLLNKSMREARLERFEDYQLKLEQAKCIIVPFNGQKVVIDTQLDKFGIIDYFPKANKVLIRKNNIWKTQGLKWLITNLLSN